MIPTTEPPTEDDIIEEISTRKDCDAAPESDDDEPEQEVTPIPSLSAMIDMTDSYQSYFEAQDDAAELLQLLAKFNNYLTKKQLKKKLQARQTTLTSDITSFVSFR